MTRPVECDNCGTLSKRNGVCNHCGEEDDPLHRPLPIHRSRGLEHVRDTRAIIRQKRGIPPQQESENEDAG